MGISKSTASGTGYAFVCAAAVLFALSGTLAKHLFNGGMSAIELIQLRTTLACASLFAWLLVSSPTRLKVAPRDIPYFLLLGTAGVGSAQFFYLLAISKIGVAAAILLHYSGPVFVALFAAVFQKERLGIVTVLSIVGTLVGCFLVVEAYNLDIVALNRTGIIAGFAAAVSFAVYSLLSARGMHTYAPTTVLVWGLLFAAILWNVLHPPFSAFFAVRVPRDWIVVTYIGVFGTVLPFGFYFEGVRRIRPAHASITATLEPITAAVLAAFFLGELLGPAQIIGCAVVIGSIVSLQLARAKPPQSTRQSDNPLTPAERS